MVDAPQWSITLAGRPLSARANRAVEEIEVSGKSGGEGGSARIIMNDKGGQAILPPDNTPVTITINGRLRFRGFVDAPEGDAARGGGQRLTLNCSAVDKSTKVKEGLNFSKADCTLQEFMDEAAKKAGMKSVKLDPELGKTKRKHWAAQGRTFLQLGEWVAKEFGATFVPRGDQAVIAARGQGKTASGQTLPTVRAVVGENVHTWRIKPKQGRPRYEKGRIRYLDRKAGKWKEEDVEFGPSPTGSGGGKGAVDVGTPRADKDAAKAAAKGRKVQAEREGGEGTVVISLNVAVEAEGTLLVIGARPGFDGPYRIESWADRISRGQPSTTTCEIKQPQGEAGTDSRTKGGAKAGAAAA